MRFRRGAAHNDEADLVEIASKRFGCDAGGKLAGMAVAAAAIVKAKRIGQSPNDVVVRHRT
jgi:hypothetical protein